MAPASDKPAPWLRPAQITGLPRGTAIVLDRTGAARQLRGRLDHPEAPDHLLLVLADHRRRSVPMTEVRRARVVASLLEDGDPVLLADGTRAGVVRTDGRQVLVETLAGFSWHPEDELLPAEPLVPSARAGRIPRDRAVELAVR